MNICLALSLFHVWLLQTITTPASGSGVQPEFVRAIPNVTVAVGREAKLECKVDHLGSYKVAWIKYDTQTLLTIDTKVIPHDKRIRVTNNSFRQWFLHIKNVVEEDKGLYMCQINTEPMISVTGYLDVLLPPTILENGTSSDIVVGERSSISLRCKASGYPAPVVFWRREDGRTINVGSYGTVYSEERKIEGEFLNLTHISRKDMGAYLCIVSNGIPPSVSKRIMLEVKFQPEIKVPDQVIGAAVGRDVTLECEVEAWPKPLISWERNDGKILLNSTKYRLYESRNLYKIEMNLKIHNLQSEDFTSYKCVAKNTLGDKEGFIRLHEYVAPTSTTVFTDSYNSYHTGTKGSHESKNLSSQGRKSVDLPTSNSLKDKVQNSSAKGLDSKKKEENLGYTGLSDRRPRQKPDLQSHPSKNVGIRYNVNQTLGQVLVGLLLLFGVCISVY
ncbi:lachesin-like isoform X1 [Tachypleus tridentatus]|uniref:lachesin-like isoform X1 n=1 Tax=Tachypleus tridentatus TaxID=6853 RepID=UPI003FCFFE53